MDAKVKDVLLVGIALGVAYFLYKEYKTGNLVATSNISPGNSNLTSPVTGVANNSGFVNVQITPATVETGIDDLYNTFVASNPVGNGGSLDSSGGDASDTGDANE